MATEREKRIAYAAARRVFDSGVDAEEAAVRGIEDVDAGYEGSLPRALLALRTEPVPDVVGEIVRELRERAANVRHVPAAGPFTEVALLDAADAIEQKHGARR